MRSDIQMTGGSLPGAAANDSIESPAQVRPRWRTIVYALGGAVGLALLSVGLSAVYYGHLPPVSGAVFLALSGGSIGLAAALWLSGGRRSASELRAAKTSLAQHIAASRRWRDELRDCEEKYRAVVEQSADNIFLMDPQSGRILEANGAMAKLLGYSADEMLTLTAYDFIAHPREDVDDKIKRVGQHSRLYLGERAYRRKDGSLVSVEVRIHLINYKGRDCLCVVARDISERKKAEAALRESERKFRLSFKQAPIGVVLCDQEGRFVQVNWAFYRLLGYTESALKDLTIHSLTHANDHDRERSLYGQCCRGEIKNFQIEVRLLKNNGDTLTTNLTATTIDDEAGDPLYVLVMFEDITDRKQADTALHYRLEFERLIMSISSRFVQLRSQDIDNGITEALKSIGEFVDVDRSYVFLMRDDGTTVDNTHEWCREGIAPQIRNLQGLTEDAFPWWSKRLRQFENIHIPRLDDLPPEAAREKEILRVQDIQSLIVVPLTSAGMLRGFLGLDSVRAEKTWSEDTIVLLKIIGEIFTHALERKQAEEALQASEEKHRAFIRNFYGIAYQLNTAADRLEFFDGTVEELTGYTAEEFLTGARRWDGLVHPDDRQVFFEEANNLRSVSGHVANTEYRILRRDGELRWVSDICRLVHQKPDGPKLLQGAVYDITERKQAEEALRDSETRFREIAELAPAGIFETDERGTITFANRQAFQYFGYTYEELQRGLNAFDLIVPDDRPRAQTNMMRVMAGDKLGVNEYVAVRKDGSTFAANVHACPVLQKGRPIGIRGIVIDITDSKRTEQESAKSDKLESIGVLAGGIAHDFNNLLTGILGNISLAKLEASPDNDAYEWLDEAEKAAGRARDLTQQLLTLSKGGEPVRKRVSIIETVRDTALFALRGSNVRPNFSFSEEVAPVEIDAGQISQVLHNLILNAQQAMPEGGVIEIAVSNINVRPGNGLPLSDGRYVTLTIRDQGIGIPRKHLPRIFDPYFTTKQSGSGLGLAVAYSIVTKHGGHIDVESEVGTGTIFRIYLPTGDKSTSDEGRPTEKLPERAGKILVMDDEDFLRDLLARVLGRYGHTVDCAREGAEAINLYRQAQVSGQTYDVVLLDLTVAGGMGGKEAIQELRKLDPGVKAIVSSGFSNDPVMADYRAYGFDRVVVKPYKAAELAEVVRELLAGSDSSGEPRRTSTEVRK
ncbi:MAG TPA: PAS domain S-box protein [Candidatus Deferrimicrobium sp.]|nr:PAS domain S-box protein [Candidatus Deferrimicrobium sp.]